jgi:Zn-dependent peptidase ImmA (M78 family)
VFCNHVAAAVLVPASSLVNHSTVVANEDPEGWTDAALDRIARDFSVSTLVVVRRLLTLGRTTERFYKEYHARAIARAEKHRLERPPQESGPPRPVMVVSDLGRAFTGTVLDAYRGRVITASDVSEYLRVRVRQIGAVQERLSLGAGE